MKKNYILLVILSFSVMGCAQGPGPVVSPSGDVVFPESVESVQRPSLEQNLVQYTEGVLAVAYSAYDKSPTFNRLIKDLDDVSVLVADSAAYNYGSSAQNEFLQIWRAQTVGVVNYAVAVRKQDSVKISQANNELGAFEKALEDFLVVQNKESTKIKVRESVGQHLFFLKKAIDAYGSGDLVKANLSEREAILNTTELARVLEN